MTRPRSSWGRNTLRAIDYPRTSVSRLEECEWLGRGGVDPSEVGSLHWGDGEHVETEEER